VSAEQSGKAGELRDVPAEELEARWQFHHALSEAAYRKLREIASEEADYNRRRYLRKLREIASEEADYNRRRYLELARTPEGKAEYHAQIASFRAAEVTPRQAHHDACKVCRECADEMLRRGLL
jgi:7-keto-8-aminopelargonate synthetase-like enzyme